MTAEIALMNKDAIALAADSAVTLSSDALGTSKVLTSADKIFTLSKFEPVAAMVYGNAHLMGVPWEAVIKLFRRDLGSQAFSGVEDYANEFLKFLHQHRELFPDNQRDAALIRHLGSYYTTLTRRIDSVINPEKQQKTKSLDEAVKAHIIERIIADDLERWKKADFLPTAGPHHRQPLQTTLKNVIRKLIEKVFADRPLSNKSKKALVDIGIFTLLKCPQTVHSQSQSGLVIAGYGEREFFPAIRSFRILGIFGDHLSYVPEISEGIGFDNTAIVQPFAQGDSVYAFMEGVDPVYQRKLESETKKLLNRYPETVIQSLKGLSAKQKETVLGAFKAVEKKLLDDYVETLGEYRNETFVSDIVSLVSSMPKSELATLAESMVNLTSLRRKMSRGVESVGGPIDVAVISKGDGLVWIKRKNYFDPALNHQFFKNYFRERNNEPEKAHSVNIDLPQPIGLSNAQKDELLKSMPK